MTVSIARLSSESGVKYLLKTTLRADVATRSLTDYYTQSSNPQGRWLGAGLAGIGVQPGTTVTPAAAQALFERAENPTTGEALARHSHQDPRSFHGAPQNRHATVAGFDLTFSVPKSISVLWALADSIDKDRILRAHHCALDSTMAWLEATAIHTRAGHNGVARLSVHGAIAASFDHWESRTGDPQLHTHVVIANHVQRNSDGAWGTLDSRTLYKATVAASEHYNGLLFDQLKRDLGTDADVRRPGKTELNPKLELTGVDDFLIREFSSRTRLIDVETDRLVQEWAQTHGHAPTATTKIRLRQQATLSTRTAKPDRIVPLSTRTQEWRNRAASIDFNAERVVAETINRSRTAPLYESDLDADWIQATGRLVEHAVAGRRATWNRWNLLAEAERICLELRCASPEDRRHIMDEVATAAEDQSEPLSEFRYGPAISSAPDLALNGHSVFDWPSDHLYTDVSTLANEDRVMAAHHSTDAPALEPSIRSALTEYTNARGVGLWPDQLNAAASILGSGRRLDAVVGPAGTGKTTTMAAVKSLWEAEHGSGSVIGLAPAAASADVLGHELDLATDNVTKWLYESTGPGAANRAERYLDAEQRYLAAIATPDADKSSARYIQRLAQQLSVLTATQSRWQFRPNQLVIVDEASMVPTHHLAALVDQAEAAGAKLVLVGDPAQLDAIDAGGMLGWLSRTGKAAQLTTIWRFSQPWERQSSLKLRSGDFRAIQDYNSRGRIHAGTYDAMVDAAYDRWNTDVQAGRSSILIAPDNDTVAMLNERAQADLVTTGRVDPESTVVLSDGLHAGRGDRILARRNDRRLTDFTGDFIRNGTLITITEAPALVGSVTGTRLDTSATITLTSRYLAESVELGYATTAHRSQGITVDTGHTLVSEGRLTRELFYVSMTRGRHSNTAYVCEPDPRDHHAIDPSTLPDWQQILSQVLAAEGAEHTAHEIRASEAAKADSLSLLMAERDYLLQISAHDDVTRLISAHSPELVDRLRESPEWSALTTAWRRAAAVDSAAAEETLVDALQPGSVVRQSMSYIRSRLGAIAQRGRQMRSAAAATPFPQREDIRLLLNDVEQRIGQRNRVTTRTAQMSDSSWKETLRALIPREITPRIWHGLVGEVARYRDRWDIDSEFLPFGPKPGSAETTQYTEHARAEALVRAVAAGAPETIRSQASPNLSPTTPVASAVQPLDLGS
ncbi:relaxase domain-containing protein [Pseudarthrobacter sp. MDT3-28]|uniref:MobF family relaxase n=1 Tax=Pseudarthrobacter raffinosi TaxID=2953651 RepID=UPI00208FD82A|nr:MobF family relaxase [Pseudarthrobacter sp. MDT3-28]MCO4239426.1 relaxase domain-containing protein [Pseudarthrobacter sp. MDT3-28]